MYIEYIYMPGGKLVLVPKKQADATVVVQQSRRKRKSKVKPTKNFVKAVKSIINKDVETKQGFHSVTAENYNSTIYVSGDCKRLVPNISQGTADNARIGDQVKAQTLSCKGAVVYNPSTGQYGTYANSRIGVRMMIVQPRQYNNLDDVQSNAGTWTAYLLKKGGTTTAFNGVLSDLWAPINSDAVIKYYDKIFYLDAPYQVTAVGSTLMGKSTKLFNINLKLRNKTLKYDSSVSSGIQPTNYAPVLLLGYVHMDGSAADSITTALQLSYDSVLNYEDA